MSVYIPGISMPKSDHPLWVVIHKDGTVEYNEWNEWKTADGKAIPVPPHGRLIDADKLGFAMMDAANVDQAMAMADDAPTIIPADKEGK